MQESLDPSINVPQPSASNTHEDQAYPKWCLHTHRTILKLLRNCLRNVTALSVNMVRSKSD